MSDTPETDAMALSDSRTDHNLRQLCRRVERERDEAIMQVENIKASSIHTCHDQCQRPMCVLRRERDEARKVATGLAEHAVRLRRERDEARAAIPDGEWVAYADHKRVHDAASRLLVEINQQLPIGIFSFIETEYRSLKDALYGK